MSEPSPQDLLDAVSDLGRIVARQGASVDRLVDDSRAAAARSRAGADVSLVVDLFALHSDAAACASTARSRRERTAFEALASGLERLITGRGAALVMPLPGTDFDAVTMEAAEVVSTDDPTSIAASNRCSSPACGWSRSAGRCGRPASWFVASRDSVGHARQMRLRRYALGARWYDVLSAERPVYRRPRTRAVALLGLMPGDRVLDVGCGTGLNLPLVRAAVGERGLVVGIDLSDPMLDVARCRVVQHAWRNVHLVRGDAAEVAGLTAQYAPFDAVLSTYALSIIDNWTVAWTGALASTRSGGRIAVVDLALPVGRWRILWPAARFACWTGGVDPRRAPWQLVERDTVEVTHEVLRGGHVHLAAGSLT